VARVCSSFTLIFVLVLAASSAAQTPAFAVVVTRRAGPLSESELRAAVATRQPVLLACLESAPGSHASVKLRLMVASDGALVVAEVQDADGGTLEECVRRAILSSRYPARPAFTTFMVELRLGQAPEAEAHGEGPQGRARLTLLLTRVRGELRPSSARRSLNEAKAQLRRCYTQDVARGGARTLRLHLVVRLDGDGRVIAVGARGGQPLSGAFERCLDRTLRHLAFPAPTSGEAEIQQSIRFEFLASDDD